MSEFRRVNTKCAVQTDKDVSLLSLLYKVNILRCFIKWLVHIVTGTCELQRILKKYKNGVCTLKIEESLLRSKLPFLRDVIKTEPKDVESAIEELMVLKNIVPATNPSFIPMMKVCLEQIHGYDALLRDVEGVRGTVYDANDETHEKNLLKLWKLLQPEEELESRISKQWASIGFQGDDPKTDFRGMGLLGLDNLLYFAEHHTDRARQVLQHSHHPKYGYSFAIVGINITSMAYDLHVTGLLRTHFFNEVSGRPSLNDFHRVFVYLFVEFDKFWVKSDPENVMAFGRVRDEFRQTIEATLRYASGARLVLTEDD